jgi:hypothetical protein
MTKISIDACYGDVIDSSPFERADIVEKPWQMVFVANWREGTSHAKKDYFFAFKKDVLGMESPIWIVISFVLLYQTPKLHSGWHHAMTVPSGQRKCCSITGRAILVIYSF